MTEACTGKVVAVEPPRFEPVEFHLAGAPLLTGERFAGAFTGSGTEELLTVSYKDRTFQRGTFDTAGGVLTLAAPQPIPKDCWSEGGSVADRDRSGRDDFYGFRKDAAQLSRLRFEPTPACSTSLPLPAAQRLAQLVTVRRFHRAADELFAVTERQDRIYWLENGQPKLFAMPLMPPWDQRTVGGAIAYGPGAGKPALLLCRRGLAQCSVQLPGQTEAFPNFFSFPEGTLQYRPLLFGDIDGDGRADVMTHEVRIGGWYAGLADPIFAFEQPVRGLPANPEGDPEYLLIDANRDGRSDLLVIPASGRPPQLFRSESSRPLAGVRLRDSADGEVVAESGADGGYVLKPGRTAALTAELPGYGFSPSSIGVTDGCPVLRAESNDGSVTARAFRRAGDDAGPYVCTGYNPGSVGKWGEPVQECPPGYAVTATDDVAGRFPTLAAVRVSAVCCRMPLPDIATSEVFSAEIECPEGSFAIGAQQDIYCTDCVKQLRCAMLNSRRYMLGPEEPGRYWGIGRNMRWMHQRTDRRDTPVALRYALGRMGERAWDPDGCIGQHYDSVLTRKSQTCDGQRYRQILYRGIAGDPPAGTPVRYFPDCDALSDEFDPVAGCVRRGSIQNPKVEP